MSGRMAKRVMRATRAADREVPLNIVSLIDIFAILVFYLLVSALVVEVLPNPKALKLPESEIKEQPHETVLIMITNEDIVVGTRKIMSTAQALGTVGSVLPGLKSELLLAPLMQVEGGTAGQVTRGEVNIMADKAIPYHLLKKVMATCTETRFAKISLAVIEKKASSGGAP